VSLHDQWPQPNKPHRARLGGLLPDGYSTFSLLSLYSPLSSSQWLVAFKAMVGPRSSSRQCRKACVRILGMKVDDDSANVRQYGLSKLFLVQAIVVIALGFGVVIRIVLPVLAVVAVIILSAFAIKQIVANRDSV
jgi:hypothetical protein